jgi:hypothetical protein
LPGGETPEYIKQIFMEQLRDYCIVKFNYSNYSLESRNPVTDSQVRKAVYEVDMEPKTSLEILSADNKFFTDPNVISKSLTNVENYKIPRTVTRYEVFSLFNLLISETQTFDKTHRNQAEELERRCGNFCLAFSSPKNQKRIRVEILGVELLPKCDIEPLHVSVALHDLGLSRFLSIVFPLKHCRTKMGEVKLANLFTQT